jgi:SpoVK/Ycf46/Vps4 family AAA+-type ATPase
LPILKRNSNSTLNFRVFEKSRSKEPKIMRISKIDSNLPKIGTVRDVSSHRCIFDLRIKVDPNEARSSYRIGKENS